MLNLHAGSSKQTQIEMRFDAGFLYKCANSLNAKLTHIWGHFLSSPPPTSGHVPTLLWLILLGLNDGQERRLWCKPLSHVAAPGLGCFLETVGFISGCTVRLWNKRLIVFFISVSTSKQILLKSWSFWRFLCYVSCFGERFLSLSFSCVCSSCLTYFCCTCVIQVCFCSWILAFRISRLCSSVKIGHFWPYRSYLV